MLRSQANKQQYLRDLLTPPGHGAGFPADTAWRSDARDYIVLAVDSEVQILYAVNETRPFRIRELVAQPDQSLKLQDLPNNDSEPLRFAFLRFSDQICKEAFETPEEGTTCVVHQVSKHLNIHARIWKISSRSPWPSATQSPVQRIHTGTNSLRKSWTGKGTA